MSCADSVRKQGVRVEGIGGDLLRECNGLFCACSMLLRLIRHNRFRCTGCALHSAIVENPFDDHFVIHCWRSPSFAFLSLWTTQHLNEHWISPELPYNGRSVV
jgi:hypothetical protein